VIDARSDYTSKSCMVKTSFPSDVHEEHDDGIASCKHIRYGINDLIRELVIENNMRYERICRGSFRQYRYDAPFLWAGPKYIRHEPYIPVMSFVPR